MELNEGFSELTTKALRVIRAAKLRHPRGVLLESFVTEAADCDRAAQHVLDQITPEGNNSDTVACLDTFCSDWSRLVAYCEHNHPFKLSLRCHGLPGLYAGLPCSLDLAELTWHSFEPVVYDGPIRPLRGRHHVPAITRRDGGICRLSGLGDSWRDRLAVYPILPPFGTGRIEIDPSLHDLLAVFLGPDLSSWVLSGCEDPCVPFGSYWLVRTSAAASFAQGFWKLFTIPTTRWEVSTCRKYAVCTNGISGLVEPAIVETAPEDREVRFLDESGLDTDMPDQRALELAARFSIPIRWTYVAKAIEQRRPPSYIKSAYATVSDALSRVISTAWRPFSRALWSLWLLAPSRVRIWAYEKLYLAGRFIYGPTATWVQRLPFGMFIKYCHLSSNGPLINEYGCLHLIRKHSSLMVPQPLDLLSDSKRSYMITSRIPGYRMGELFSMLSDEQLGNLTSDLNKFLSELRAIPKDARPGAAPATAVTGATGGSCHHVRMELMYHKRGPFGPFATEEEFHDCIRTRRAPAPDEIQLTGHDIVLTHGDLSLRNILVDRDGRLAGVVDWEHAGWYPTYWELTSFLFDNDSLHTPQRLMDMTDGMFQGFGNFERELQVERRLWERIF